MITPKALKEKKCFRESQTVLTVIVFLKKKIILI